MFEMANWHKTAHCSVVVLTACVNFVVDDMSLVEEHLLHCSDEISLLKPMPYGQLCFHHLSNLVLKLISAKIALISVFLKK